VGITLWGGVVIAALILIAVGVYLLTRDIRHRNRRAGISGHLGVPPAAEPWDDEPAPSNEDHELDDGEPEQP
jgi:hypothetical protein